MKSSNNSKPGPSKSSGSPKKSGKSESPSRYSKPSPSKGGKTPSRYSKASSSQPEESPSSSSRPSTTSGSRSEKSSPRYSKPSRVEAKPFTSLKPGPSKSQWTPLKHSKKITGPSKSKVETSSLYEIYRSEDDSTSTCDASLYGLQLTASKCQGISPRDEPQPVSLYWGRRISPTHSSLSSDQSIMISPRPSKPGSIQSESFDYIKPGKHNKGQQVNIRACKVCHLIKDYDRFLMEGCDNCEEVLQLKNDPVRADYCTSSDFDETYEKERKESIYIEQWHRVCELNRGLYAKYVRGIIPAEVLLDLERAGYVYDLVRDVEEMIEGRL